MADARIIYFGTMGFAVPPLERLLADPRYEVALVVSQPERPAGRGQTELKTWPVAGLARERGLPLLQPDSLKVVGVRERIADVGADLFVVAAYGKIIPADILALARIAAVNLHGSLLPAYRGASPIQAAVLDGLRETGVTLMRMDEKMDHGPVYATARAPVADDETARALERKLAVAAGDLLTDALPRIISGDLRAVPQDHDAATFAKMIAKEDGQAKWAEENAQRIARKVRAYDYEGGPGCFTFIPHRDKRLRLRIVSAVAEEGDGLPGSVVAGNDGYPVVHAKKGAVRLISVQVEGKKPIDGRELLRGYASVAGATLD